MLKKSLFITILVIIFIFNISISLSHNHENSDIHLGKLNISLFEKAYSASSNPCPDVVDEFCMGPWVYRCIENLGTICVK